MATSDTFTSGRYGGSYGPWLTLKWEAKQQHVASNSTEVEFTLTFHWDHSINKTFRNHPGTLYGESYTATGSATGSKGSKVLHTFKKWIYHDSNGTKSATVSGNVTGLGLTYSGVKVNTMSVSGTMNLNRIARASEIKTAKMGNLINGNGATLNVTSTNHSKDFYHKVSIWDGSVWMWDSLYYKGSPDGKYPVTKEGVNRMLNRMSTTTSKSFWIGLYTYTGNNGSGHIGTTSMYVTANVDDSVKPSSSKFSIGIDGSGYDKTLGEYIQGMTKVTGKYNSSAGYGATIASETFTIRRKTSNTDSQTITGNSGTMSKPVALSGKYEAWGTITDTRGRWVYTNTIDFTVTAYSPPKITNFTAVRNSSTPTTVNISRATTHTVIGTSNHLSFTVQRRPIGGTWANVNTRATGSITASPSGDLTSISTGNSVLASYDFRYVVTDRFGHSAEAIISVATQRVVLDIHKNEGIGIGKIHEKGVLDVDGEAFYRGKITLEADNSGSVLNLMGNTPTGHGYLSFFGSDNVRKAYTGFGSTSGKDFQVTNESGGDLNLKTSGSGKLLYNGTEILEEGSNSLGEWIKFKDGNMISRGYVRKTLTINQAWGSLYYANVGKIKFPLAFSAVPYVQLINSSAHALFIASAGNNTSRTETGNIDIYRPTSGTSGTYDIGFVAIGRWKN